MAATDVTTGGTSADEAAPQVPLRFPLDEFRTALEVEIDAASRESAAAAVALHSGRRIGQIGAQYQYVFKIESALNLPTDSPGELHVSDRDPANATVISVEGLTVTVSVAQDLGANVPFARLRNDFAFLLRRLIERIEAYADKPNPAGDRLLGDAPATGDPAVISIDGLNDQQEAAVASSLGRDTTFIWGPPGTGKTATIGHIGAELHARDRSLLLVSHTNIAVDQALMRIADLIEADQPGTLDEGKILRVGEPRDGRLRERPELLLAEHARRRSEELAAELDRLHVDRDELVSEAVDQQRLADLAEWVELATAEIAEQQHRLKHIDALHEQMTQLAAQAAPLAEAEAAIRKRRQLALDAIQAQQRIGELASQLRELEHNNAALQEALAGLRDARASAQADVDRAEQLQPVFTELRSLPDAPRCAADAEAAAQAVGQARGRLAETMSELEAERDILEQTTSSGGLARRWKGLPRPEDQQRTVASAINAHAAVRQQLEDAEQRHRHAQDRQQRQAELASRLTSDEEHLENLPAIREAHLEAASRCEVAELELEQLRRTLREREEERDVAESTVKAFTDRFSESPTELADRAADELGELDRLRIERARVQHLVSTESNQLDLWLRDRLDILVDNGLLTRATGGTLDARLSQVADAHRQARRQLQGRTAAGIRRVIAELNRQIEELAFRILEVEEALARVEEQLIADATIVATTLTRAYLRDYVQDRRFDTVILDEASMAPIPALWAAAGVADRGVVIVGDPEQLPPIKHSQLDVAEKWLGQEVFTVAGVTNPAARRNVDHLVHLRTQYRMHPAISRLANKLVYDGLLIDAPGAADDADALDGWYDRGWGRDEPVLLVDTGPLDAWVTTVDRGTKTSRLNFLSATIACDLAEKMLAADRTQLEPGEPPRVLIVTPYRPQANLLEKLIEHQGLDTEVAVGTAHSFQGNEAPIVILDLVVDEPHWRVGLFIPALDEQNRKLLNVAITRARKRLIVVGDFDYAAKKAKTAFLGRLVHELRLTAPSVPADDLLTVGLAAKTAATHLNSAGGPLEPEEERLVVTEADFFRYLAWDLAHATDRVIIYSPFLTVNRLEWLDAHLRAATERDVRVYVVTKPLDERSKREQASARAVEDRLERIDVHVLHKRKMHEKIIIIDQDVTWVGSLNALSFANTGEVMERRRNRKVVDDYTKILHVDEIAAAIDDGEVSCPVCGVAMDAAEGDRGPYWRCPDKCFTRSLDQPAPKGGLLSCRNCGGGLHYGDWGGKPHWRCEENPRHRMVVRASHLRLPKMSALVPPRELSKLRRTWHV